MQEVSDYYRFCPDRVEVKISDAVCIARRRVNYPVCRGCQFNDDELADSEDHSRMEAPTKVDDARVEKVFKAYDVRGTYPDPLNEDLAWRIGCAAATFLREALPRPEWGGASVVVGRDMRKSSPSMARALTEGIRAAGVGVQDVGMIDTSQLYFAVNHLEAAGGIQTTASHNPAQYNGFKICGRGGIPIGETTGLNEIRRTTAQIDRYESSRLSPYASSDLSRDYKTFVRRFLEPISPTKIVIDASNGMAGKWAPHIFGDVPKLECVFLNTEMTGEFVHDPNPLVDANLDQLRAEIRQTGADFGACFDGDADRCILVDERSEIVRCDMLTALLAGYFLKRSPGATVVYDLRSSRVVADEIKAHGGSPRRERVGHAFMKQALRETDAVFGGELSGHFYFRDNYYCDSGMLALVHVLNVLTQENASLSSLIAPLVRYYASGERNFENADPQATLEAFAAQHAGANVDLLDGVTINYDEWWCNIRKSNTEPLLRLNLEANTPELLAQKLDEIAADLGKPVNH